MALVPKYIAKLNTALYTDIIDWTNPVTYTRPIPPAAGSMPGHTPSPQSETKNMRPLMRPFTDPVPSFYINNGHIDSQYAAQYYVDFTASFGYAGDVNLSTMLQAQMIGWQQHADYSVELINAIESRMIEDTWLTAKALMTVEEYDAEISIASTFYGVYSLPDTLAVAADFVVTPENSPNPTLTATPCNMRVDWQSGRKSYRTRTEITSVLGFYSDPPEIEPVAKETGGYTRMQSSDFATFGGITNTAWPFPEVIPQYIEFGGRSIYIYHCQPFMYEWVDANYWLGVINENTESTFGDYTSVSASAGPSYLAGVMSPSHLIEGPWGNDRVLYAQDTLTFSRSEGGEASIWVSKERPKAWKYDDPEFVGYFPFTYYLWNEQNVLKEYCLNPDDRFDGLYFHHKIKIATATRAWQGLVYNKLETNDPGPYNSMGCALEQVQWYNTETGETILAGNGCSAMTPITSDNWLSPGVVGPILIPGYDWEGYDWPATSVTIPAGTFLLEDGSPAPIYPTFYGAYVYDLHLKKWGKFDGEYKRLLDYSAINTYLPSQQSYTRFGIFGGILTSDGKIRIFDEFPTVSQITYGKIGYYRQGMTSLEEVRVHHREFKTGSIKIESSVEGKLIDGAFTLEEPFVDSSSWIKKGGYSAKWHNVTIKGQFDLTYLEFRGITTGKR